VAIAAAYTTLQVHVVRMPGERVEWGELYNRMQAHWGALCPWSEAPCLPQPAPSAAEFAAALAHVCRKTRKTGIQVKVIDGDAYCIDLVLLPLTLPACASCPHRALAAA
jgi:hypothetical protein